MLSVGLIHADLSDFNVLVAADPVIIDLPQAANAPANNGACEVHARDVNDLLPSLGRCAPDILATEFALEVWAPLSKVS